MKVGLISLGCPKNLVDSEVMLGLAQQAGHELTRDPGDAEVLVVNTCAFIDSAKQESIDAILEMAERKKAGGCQRLIVTGCLAERYRDRLKAEIPEIDVVLGTGEVPEIVGAIGASDSVRTSPLTFFGTQHPREYAEHRRDRAEHPRDHTEHRRDPAEHPRDRAEHPRDPAEHPRDPAEHPRDRTEHPRPSYLYDASTPRLLATPRHYAYVKIAEGCDYKCAFCIIPTLRGAYRSRGADSILQEARDLAARGVRELVLISQDTTFYGVDKGERGALARLLRQLNDVDGLKWIRLLYLYPTTIDDATLDAMAECDKVCAYIDLPLQHASNRVLKRMKRPGTRESYDRLLHRIRRVVPDVAFRTTFIVGFPGETEDDVDELCGFVADHEFDNLGVFTYSHEEGTSAYELDNDVPHRTKQARRNKVMRLQKRLVTRRQKELIGRRLTLLIDGPSGESELVIKGRLASQAPDIDGAVFLTECDPSTLRGGDFVEVEITGAREYDLIARPIAVL